MELDNDPSLGIKPPPLNSDQLNYLVWRYLQESGYPEAAVKLQRDWKADAESLPFAKNIKGQALISLVQKGLRYHHLSLTIDENGQPSKQLQPSMFYFGPANERQQTETRDTTQIPLGNQRAPSPTDSSTTSRKHGINGVSDSTGQTATKRGRKSTNAANMDRNGINARKTSAQFVNNANMSNPDLDMVNGHTVVTQETRSPSATEAGMEENGIITNGFRPDDRMDVDTDGEMQQQLQQPQSQRQESPTEPPLIESAPLLLHTLNTGESVGVQVAPAKVANLGPTTTILQVPHDKHVTRAMWRPRDAAVLTAAGDDFCGLWRLSDHGYHSGLSPLPFQELIEQTKDTLVSAIAWEPNGSMLAVATYSNQSGQLHLFDGQDLGLLETLPASQRAITCLRWQKSGLRLVGIAPYDDQNSETSIASTILLWDLSGSQSIAGPLSVTVPETILDIDCAFHLDQGIVCAAGESVVYYCRAFTELEVEQKWRSPPPSEHDQWTFVKCAWQSANDATLIAASAETGRIWMPAKELVKSEAHNAPITGLELRPRSANAALSPQFATASVDGTVKIWQYDRLGNSIQSLFKLIIGNGSPIMTLSYSPDGFCLAAASYSTVRIWNAEHGYNHMANWQGSDDEWPGAGLKEDDTASNGAVSTVNGDSSQSSSDHSLSWDVDSKKLAFGLGSRVALINFQR